MSWAEENVIDFDEDEYSTKKPLFIVLGNGTKVCANCGSKNIKVSAKGNEYCSEICWDKTQTNLTIEEEL